MIYILKKINDKKKLDQIIYKHIQRILFDFNNKKISEITSFDLIGYLLSLLITSKNSLSKIDYIKYVVNNQLDKLGMEVIPVDLRDAYAFGGGLHCCTADVYREGELKDYFPRQQI